MAMTLTAFVRMADEHPLLVREAAMSILQLKITVWMPWRSGWGRGDGSSCATFSTHLSKTAVSSGLGFSLGSIPEFRACSLDLKILTFDMVLAYVHSYSHLVETPELPRACLRYQMILVMDNIEVWLT